MLEITCVCRVHKNTGYSASATASGGGVPNSYWYMREVGIRQNTSSAVPYPIDILCACTVTYTSIQRATSGVNVSLMSLTWTEAHCNGIPWCSPWACTLGVLHEYLHVASFVLRSLTLVGCSFFTQAVYFIDAFSSPLAWEKGEVQRVIILRSMIIVLRVLLTRRAKSRDFIVFSKLRRLVRRYHYISNLPRLILIVRL